MNLNVKLDFDLQTFNRAKFSYRGVWGHSPQRWREFEYFKAQNSTDCYIIVIVEYIITNP